MKQWCGGIRPPYCTGMRIFTILTAGTLLLAQDQLPTLKVDVDVVSILASVRDKKNALIPNLKQENLPLPERRKAANHQVLRQGDRPAAHHRAPGRRQPQPGKPDRYRAPGRQPVLLPGAAQEGPGVPDRKSVV